MRKSLLAVLVIAGTTTVPRWAEAICADDAPCGGGGNGPSLTTVTGRFRYLDGTVLRPLVSAKVEVWRFAPRGVLWGWGNDAVGYTDASGNLRATLPFGVPGITYGLRVFGTNYAAQVWPSDVVDLYPFYREPGEPGPVYHRVANNPGETLDFTYDYVDDWATKHFNAAETIRLAYDYAAARRDPRETEVIGVANLQPSTFSMYNPLTNTIDMSDPNDDFLILHEYAHYLEAQISSFAWIVSYHTGCNTYTVNPFNPFDPPILSNTADHAWMEGFADYYAQAVAQSLPAGTLRGGAGTPSVWTLERQPACAGLAAGITGDMVELYVAGVLWDLHDRPTDPGSRGECYDNLNRMDTEILQIFDHELDVEGVWPTISMFHDAWVARGLDHLALDQELQGLSVPHPESSATVIHSECVMGGALAANGCSACVTRVCATDPYCCATAWDSLCVSEAQRFCGTCTVGTCAHPECSTGARLTAGCDSPPLSPSCTNRVCSSDGYCCATAWDDVCVDEAETWCGLTCG